MNRRSLGALIALNLALSAALALITLASPSPAEAQLGGPRPQYTMIAGAATGRDNQAMIYIIETTTGRVLATFFNSANNRFEVMASRDVSGDL
jgi:hypothetical protein